MKNKNLAKTLVALMSSVALAGSATAEKGGGGNGKGGGGGGNGKGGGQSQHGNGNKPDKGDKGEHGKAAKDVAKGDKKDSKPDKIVRFVDKDRNSIIDYFSGYRDRENGLPPGLAKNVARGKPLPPGWQKKIEPGYRIEDDLWSGFTPVPDEWFPSIRREPDTRFYFHGDRVVRVYEPRREILDVVVVPSLLR
jgi:hypothetical protein